MSSVYPFPTVERSRPHRGAYTTRIIYARGDTFNNTGTRYVVNTGHFVSGAGGRTFAQELAAGFFIVDPAPPTFTGPVLPALTAGSANHYYRINAAGNAVGTTPTIPAKITPWAASTAVEAGETRSINGALYTSNSARTTTAAFNAAEAANWTAISGRYRGVFLTGAYYHIGDLIADPTDNNLYRCTTAYAAGATRAANAGNWQVQSRLQYRGDFATGTAYVIGNVVHDGGSMYRCTVAHTSGATLATNAGNWAKLSERLLDWPASARIELNETRVRDSAIWRSLSTRTTTATWNAAEQANWLRMTGGSGATEGIFDAQYFRGTTAGTTYSFQAARLSLTDPTTGIGARTAVGVTTHTAWASTAAGFRDVYLWSDQLGQQRQTTDVAHQAAPVAPAGRPYRAFVGTVLFIAGNVLRNMIVRGRQFFFVPQTVITLTGAAAQVATYATQSYAALVPVRAEAMQINGFLTLNVTPAVVALMVALDTTGIGRTAFAHLSSPAGLANDGARSSSWIGTNDGQQLFYGISGAPITSVNRIELNCSGYRL